MPDLSEATLKVIQGYFHEVIRGRVNDLIDEHRLNLPDLSLSHPTFETKAWFPVPGMAGGFAFWFEGDEQSTRLITESWSRLALGSGQRHEITAQGSRLVAEGFV